MAANRPSRSWWALLLGERDWSLLGIAAAVVAIGLLIVFVLASRLVDGFWFALLAVVAGLICIAIAAWAFSNLVAVARLKRGRTPAEQDIDQRLERRKAERRTADPEDRPPFRGA